jgi:alpha-1,2-mannosyltransferase
MAPLAVCKEAWLMDAGSLSLSASRQRWFVLGLLLFFVAVSVQYSVKTRRDYASAIQRWHDPIRSLDQGTNIWKELTHPNTPFMAMLLRPLTHLPARAEALGWFYIKVVMTFFALVWAFRLVETPDRPFPLWAKVVAILLSLRPIMGDLMHGNVNLLILFLVIGCLYAFRQGRDVLSGLVLALAIACKITPALFVPYFVWKRQWKTLAACAVGLGLFFWLVPGLVFGFERNATYLDSWTEQMVKPFVVAGKVFYSEHNNQSLPGLVVRLLTPSPSFSIYIDGSYTPLQYHNLLSLDPRSAGWVVKGCMALFALLGIWVCRTPTTPRTGWRLSAEFSLVLLGMLLFSERTWKHHCVTLVLPFCVLTYYLAACRPTPGLRSYLVGTLAAVALLMAATGTGLLDDHFGKMAQVYGAYVWSCLLLVAALMVLLRRPETPPGPAIA